MLKNAIPFAVMFGALACVAPQRPAELPSSDLDSLKTEVRKLQESVAHLDNRLGHLQTEVSAASAENELTSMTIDSVHWPDDSHPSGFFGKSVLLCHVVEWRGYGKMLRFARMADPKFVLESEGHPVVDAHIETGGITSSDGATRFVILTPSKPLDQGARYHLRPLNQNEKYHWSVPADLETAPAAHVEVEQHDSDPFGSRKLGSGAK